jgi:hypothetical protein
MPISGSHIARKAESTSSTDINRKEKAEAKPVAVNSKAIDNKIRIGLRTTNTDVCVSDVQIN